MVGLPFRLIPTPIVDCFEERSTIRLIKLVGSISPGLEQRVREQTVPHNAASQFVSQHLVAPFPIKKPIVGHIVIVANHIGRDVRECATHLRK